MTDMTDERSADDVGPGFLDAADHGVRQGIQGYVIGLAFAVLLTVASFYAVNTTLIWGPGIPVALVTLAVAQIDENDAAVVAAAMDPAA